ncbi:MAG: deoxyguanosinetriphosphate triphosphohydrolase, partial [Deltaproteobacteria bacterium]|nr:deoxyguanosinetriphosphate triphosphohydrolase [Deltaproteobacteria bacterium]
MRTGYPTLEAQIVNLADEIAYNNHDLDDGLQSRLLDLRGLADLPLWREAEAAVAAAHGAVSPKLLTHQTIRRLIHRCIVDLQEETMRRITDGRITTRADVRERGKDLVAFSSTLAPRILDLKHYLFRHLYRHEHVEKMATRAKGVVADLFAAYQRDPTRLPAAYAALAAAEFPGAEPAAANIP